MGFKLLDAFEGLFRGGRYRHRVSNQGDRVAGYLYEDLLDLLKSPKLARRVIAQDHVLNKSNKATGRDARRGDATFGERVPSMQPITEPGLAVAQGAVATIEIGVEVKILAKAMIKQIYRVCTDMRNQAAEIRTHHRNAICVGIAGINHASAYTGYERNTEWPTNGRKYKHPIQVAAEAEQRIMKNAAPVFDDMLILRFVSTNVDPFPFAWVDLPRTNAEYSAALIRISREYEQRF